jgi:hypothetical protein
MKPKNLPLKTNIKQYILYWTTQASSSQIKLRLLFYRNLFMNLKDKNYI